MEDHEQIQGIYRAFRQELFTCALSITRHPESAEDAIQEAFFRLFRQDLSGIRDLKLYVFRSVRNAAIDQFRRNLPSATAIEECTHIIDLRDDPSQAAERKESAQVLAMALENLTDDERETVTEHIYGDLTFREIAEIRQVPKGTISAWYYRALEKLKGELEAMRCTTWNQS